MDKLTESQSTTPFNGRSCTHPRALHQSPDSRFSRESFQNCCWRHLIKFILLKLKPRSHCSVFVWERSKTYSFRHCVHTDTLQIRSFSNTQTNTHTFEYGAYWIRSVFSVNTKYGNIWMRRYSFNENICLEMGLVVWTPHEQCEQALFFFFMETNKKLWKMP